MSHSKVIDEIADELFKEFFGTETNPYYGKFINGDVLTKELTDILYELAKKPIDIDEEFLDKFNSIGCTSFMLIPTQDKSIKIAYDKEPTI